MLKMPLRAGLMVVSLCCLYGAAAHAAPPRQAQNQPLRVATGPIAPFVIKQGDSLTGFSVELWDEIARRLGREFTWIESPTSDQQIALVQNGGADMAISAIAMTPSLEPKLDFSVPYFDSGLQIMVHTQASHPVLDTLTGLFAYPIRQFFGIALLIVFGLANVLWFVERRDNPTFQHGYLRGVAEGMWGVMLIIATGEHGDRDLAKPVKRLIIAVMWLLGVVLVAQFTATVTSSLTVSQLQSSINGPGDLPGKTIATVPNTYAAQYLTQLGLPFVEVTSADQGYNLLTQGQVQAIVFDAPTLQYWAAKRGQGVLEVVGPIFRPVKYGIAMPEGSPLRKQINQALLEMYQDGTYERIYDSWFSQGK
jgi:polar amino acid transport system substrate-binding protein